MTCIWSTFIIRYLVYDLYRFLDDMIWTKPDMWGPKRATRAKIGYQMNTSGNTVASVNKSALRSKSDPVFNIIEQCKKNPAVCIWINEALRKHNMFSTIWAGICLIYNDQRKNIVIRICDCLSLNEHYFYWDVSPHNLTQSSHTIYTWIPSECIRHCRAH